MKNKEFRKLIKETVQEYRKLIFSGEFNIDIIYDNKLDKDKPKTNASIDIDLTYLDAKIVIHPPLKKYYGGNKKEIKRIILHEICHILTEPQYEHIVNLMDGNIVTRKHIEEVRERQTERISIIINNLTN